MRCAVALVECLPAGGETFPLPLRCRLEVHVHCRYVTLEVSNNVKSALQRTTLSYTVGTVISCF